MEYSKQKFLNNNNKDNHIQYRGGSGVAFHTLLSILTIGSMYCTVCTDV